MFGIIRIFCFSDICGNAELVHSLYSVYPHCAQNRIASEKNCECLTLTETYCKGVKVEKMQRDCLPAERLWGRTSHSRVLASAANVVDVVACLLDRKIDTPMCN